MATEKIVESFLAENDAGTVYEIHKFQAYLQHRSNTGGGLLPTSARFETSGGEDVNQIDDDNFEIVWSHRDDNEKIRRV